MKRTPLLVLIALSGCSSGTAPPDPAALTYYKDVKPLVEQKCLGCHSEGGIAPFTLTSYEDVAAHKAEIKVAVQNRVMPPWLAGKGCADYAFDRSLSDAEIAKVTGWVTAGAVAGTPAQYVAPAVLPTSKLSRVDRSLSFAEAYTPVKSPDDYRCFLVDWPETTDTFVTGFRANPGNKQIVHHVIAFISTPADVAGFQQLDAAEAGQGWTCFGGPGGNNQRAPWLGSWAPGSEGTDFPPGTGIKMPAGSKLVIQVHYNTSATAPAPDLTTIDVKIDSQVTKQAIQQPWTNVQWVRDRKMVIPAGMPDVMHSYTIDPTPFMGIITNNVMEGGKPFTIYAAGLHMHTRGTSATLEVVRGTGVHECLLDIPRWDFHWQGGYGFTTPKVFNPGDQIAITCHWDNSATTHDVNWGEGTDDEMCLGGIYITQ
jgi:hypothetical protein